MKKRHYFLTVFLSFSLLLSACTANETPTQKASELSSPPPTEAQVTNTVISTPSSQAFIEPPSVSYVRALFKSAAAKLIQYEVSGPMDILDTDFIYVMVDFYTYKNIKGYKFYKTNLEYKQAEEYYSAFFTGAALEKFLGMCFYNEKGVLYVNEVGGASGFSIGFIQVAYQSQNNGQLLYNITYSILYEFENSPTQTRKVYISKVGNTFKIANMDFLAFNAAHHTTVLA